MRAYGVSYLRPYLVVGPASLDKDRYDIEAKIRAGATQEQFLGMLRSLLAERFGLVARWEKRNVPIYEVTVAKGGHKLSPPEKAGATPDSDTKVVRDQDGWPVGRPGTPAAGWNDRPDGSVRRVDGRMQSVAGILETLERSSSVDRPLVDKTGLTGIYDFKVDFAPQFAAPPLSAARPAQANPADPVIDAAPGLLTAMERQLGLKLTPAKGPFMVLVVDRVNSEPTQN
jgi:uncharacterized protein (TIGR03435 family)